MSTASIGRNGLQEQAVAIIRGDAPPRMRHRAAQLLAECGFAVTAGASKRGGLVVVICDGGDTDRVRAVREGTASHAGAPVLAVMPAGAPNASLRRVLLAGASGIVFDDDLDRALAPSARAMLAGQLVVPLVLSQQIAPRPLSHREKQILGLVVLGFTNREIAQKLYLAESTVKTHLSSAFRKIDARSRSEAVARIQDPESGYGMGILAIVDGASAPAA
jgi:DNA-binding NarL/FixJ family response regulator